MRTLTPLALLAVLVAVPVVTAQPLGLGIDTTAFDRSVRPQDDFFRFVNGGWLARTEIPADRSRYGAFDMLAEQSQMNVRAILEEAARGGFADDPDGARIGAYFTAYIDSARADALGARPIAEDLARVEQIRSHDDLPAYFAHVHRAFGTSPFNASVGQDARNATQYALYASQGGLGLPDRSYYLEEGFATQRAAYQAYITQLHDLAGLPSAGVADAVLAFETALAQVQWTRVQNRDREATYNKVAVADFAAQHPHLGFGPFLAALGADVDSVIVRQPSYFRALDSLVAATPIDTWKQYFRTRVLDSAATFLSNDFVQAHFQFRGRTLSGQQALSPRWKRAVNSTNGALGEAVGRLYVGRHFRPEAKARMDELIANLREAFRRSIEELDWMSEETKAQALLKLEKFTPKVGYPERWRDYSALAARPDDLVGNVRRAMAFGFNYNLNKLGRPVDRLEWGMTPQTVNAYYSSTMNEIVFPAAILQPPFFNVAADDATNYGAIGAVIGHEFSHGFDDQGRKSDGDGNMRDWWTEADAAEYTRRASAIVEQYGGYQPLPDTPINGELTLGENIGDLAGLAMAYRAYRLSLNGQEPPVINGFTGDQRFFMGWAQVWRTKHREEFLRQLLRTDTHSPGEYRTNGIVQHLDAFHAAFGTQEGDGMWRAPEERIRIW
ncbi:MAG TPA: M13 family metallopeptidase [Rubricoccaceae bacterium]|nr:M13 family metallopeptidase [Rubricoccaceae bacterium]